MLLTGIFATTAVSSCGADGLLYGVYDFFFTQVKAMLIAVSYSFLASLVVFKIINF